MSSTTFSKGVQFGGDNDFKVRHGGNIRVSFPVESSAAFLEGNVLELNSSGELQLSTAQNNLLTGVTSTRRSPVSDQENDQTIGSGKAVLILDPSVIQTAELASGANFSVNDQVYQDEAGHWTHAVPGTDTRIYGYALNSAQAADGDVLEFYYLGAQGEA